MREPTIEDHVLLMLSMKRETKFVTFKHILEKLQRDYGKVTEEELRNILDRIVKEGFVEWKNDTYRATEKGRKEWEKRYNEIDEEKLNPTYLLVWKAKKYYKVVSNEILKFLSNRYVAVRQIFTAQVIFRRKFKGKLIQIRDKKELFFWINMHGLDFGVYLNEIGSNRASWIVFDIDGELEKTKKVTIEIEKILKDEKINFATKFSGSRGFHIWIKPSKPIEFERAREFIKEISKQVKVPSSVKIDYAINRINGIVRIPYSIHYKTYLISCPVKDLKKLKLEDAKIESVMKRFRSGEFTLRDSTINGNGLKKFIE
ncbi:MAG: hypothetical protein J7L43_01525 [Candidatus Aenigmarchaeota archaeon]|nr:hypothetical protein [Candidatus Aenigmarchaeota archaeon]